MIGIEESPAKPVAYPVRVDSKDDLGGTVTIDGLDLRAWKAALGEDLDRSIASGPWPSALIGVGWVHLLFFTGCQAVYDPAVLSDSRHPMLWVAEFFAVLLLLRLVVGRDWMHSSPAIYMVAKLWISFLILSFNVVTLNALTTGFEHDWYKPVWGTLSSFLFASLAWLFSPLFLIPAVQMWLTGLLIVRLPSWSYLIYGVSWWLALVGIATYVRRKRPAPGS